MPLHAAGDYAEDDPELRAYNYAVHSYTPSISALLQASISTPPVFSGILAVTDSSTLPGTLGEAGEIRQQVGDARFTHLDAETATQQAVSAAMASRSWIHMGCLGIQNDEDPLESVFRLHDGDLSLHEIMQRNLEHEGFTFLNVYQPQLHGKDIVDDTLPLAAGLLSAGFRTVFTSLWAMRDEDRSLIARELYARLIDGEKGAGDGYNRALALHDATMALRRSVGEKNVTRWAPVVHVGM